MLLVTMIKLFINGVVQLLATSSTSTVSSGGGTTGGVTSVGGGTTNGIAGVVASAASAANNIVTGSFNAGRFRAGEAASMGTTVNLTVNGAIDSEGTARTIVNTLNDSFYRGTGGANSLQIA